MPSPNFAECQIHIDDLMRSIKLGRDENNNLRTQNEQLKAQLAANQHDKNDAEIVRLRTIIVSHSAKIQELTGHESEITSLKKAYRMCSESRAKYARDFFATRDQLDKAKQSIANWENTSYAQVTHENSELRNALAKAKDESEELRQMNTAQMRFHKEACDAKNEAVALRIKLNEALVEREKLKAQIPVVKTWKIHLSSARGTSSHRVNAATAAEAIAKLAAEYPNWDFSLFTTRVEPS